MSAITLDKEQAAELIKLFADIILASNFLSRQMEETEKGNIPAAKDFESCQKIFRKTIDARINTLFGIDSYLELNKFAKS